MTYQVQGFTHSLVAAADLSSSMFCAVTVDSNGKVNLPSAGGRIVGILTDKQIAGQAITFQMSGVAEWKLGGTVAAGDVVKTDASGRAVTASAADINAGQGCGVCLVGGTINKNGAILLQISQMGVASGGTLDTALDTGALDTAPIHSAVFFSIADTKSAALPAGYYAGQILELHCDAVSGTPDGSVTGTFLSQAGAAGTSLAYNAAGDFARLVWTGAAWRVLALNSVALT